MAATSQPTTRKNGPAVASDLGQFKQRELSEDERLRADADKRLLAMQQRRSCEYKSLETGETVELSLPLIKSVVSVPTRNGILPDDRECFKFMKLCEARRLNPLVGDAYLIGYETRQGPNAVAKWNIIVAHSALLKRAELSGQYNGLESGVIVRDKESGSLIEQVGDFFDDETQVLVGGWAKVYRKDREIAEYDRLKLSVYNTQLSRWEKDPGGMIVKVAEASVLRRAFPGETAGMYVAEELDAVHVRDEAAKSQREFDVDEIDPSEDRLAKKATTKPTASKPSNGSDRTPSKASAERSAPPASKDVQKDDRSSNAKPERQDEPEAAPVDEMPADEMPAEQDPFASSQNETSEQELSGTEDGAVDTVDAYDDELANFCDAIEGERMIRRIREMRDRFKSEHALNGERAARIDEIVAAREKEIRAEMAG